MARLTRIRTRKMGSATEILALVNHPMDTGRAKNKKTGKLIPAHFIEKFNFAVNGKEVASANLGPAVSKNAMVGVRVSGVKSGDTVTVSWNDNMKESGSASQKVR